MATASKGAQADKKAKVKLLAASVVLGVAVVWILVYLTTMGGGEAPPPVLAPEVEQKLNEEHAVELEKVKKEQNDSFRGGKPTGPPGSS